MKTPSALAAVALAASTADADTPTPTAAAPGAQPAPAAPVAAAAPEPVSAAVAIGLMANAFPAMAGVFTALEATCNAGATEAAFTKELMIQALAHQSSAAAAQPERPLGNAAPDNAVAPPRAVKAESIDTMSIYANRNAAMKTDSAARTH
jgi:hypothetical protein